MQRLSLRGSLSQPTKFTKSALVGIRSASSISTKRFLDEIHRYGGLSGKRDLGLDFTLSSDVGTLGVAARIGSLATSLPIHNGFPINGMSGIYAKSDKRSPSGDDKENAIEKNEKDNGDDQVLENEHEKEHEDQSDIPSEDRNENENKNSVSNSGKSSSSAGSKFGSRSPNGGDNGDGDGSRRGRRKRHASGKNDKLPEIYPQMLALPISKRPLFPGFYKAVAITDPNVMKAIKTMLDRQQPYVGAFMIKNPDIDTDVIEDINDVYNVGVLAQITSAFPGRDEATGKETMTALLYPHRRIRIDELIPPSKETQPVPTIEEILDGESEGESSVSGTETSEGVETVRKEHELEHENATKDEVIPQSTAVVEGAQVAGPTEQSVVVESDFGEIEDEKSNPMGFLKNFHVSLVKVSNLEDEPFDSKSPVINALTSEILKVFKEISHLNNMFREQIATFSASIQSSTTNIFEEPAKLADFAAAVSAGEEDELQDILNSLNIEQRLEKSLTVLKKELMNAELQHKISKDVETKIQKRQREYYLMEQLKGIKRELGIDDGRDKLIEDYKKRMEKLNPPDMVQKVFDEEVMKISTLETSMSEFGVIRNYLDWLTSLPWGLTSKGQFSIESARTVLNEDHYGMKDAKDRILEFIAVGKLLGKVDGKIVCFVGPPGVGKTSIGKSIARALKRRFFRFSVGGMSDVAEIKGHRRTYIGALPGRIIQALKKCQTLNPLILIDEIDKIGHGGINGDPAAALLEVLDPEQNNSFLDNYLDIPIDLSKVLFVCTANSLDTIPRPLLDRMEVIELTGYIAEEKIKIAEQYLVPQAKKSAGLENAKVEITDEALNTLIKQYCRESGVRTLKKQIEKIYRKAALVVLQKLDELKGIDVTESQAGKYEKGVTTSKQASDLEGTTGPNEGEGIEIEKIDESAESMKVPDEVSVVIDVNNLQDYVGPPIYTTDRLYETTPAGVVMGLAWTNMGGCSLYVESVLEQPLHLCKHPSLERTGQLGNVMKESSRLAYSFSKMFLAKKFPENRFFEHAAIHLHCPEGATPKDGPSAGVTMATSFLSLALNKAVDPTVAMTGELTLTGKVLRIGGLREKAVAAKRSGAKTIIFPKDNLSDWEELPENVRKGLEPVPVDWYDEIFSRLFSDITTETGNNVWKAEFELMEEQKRKEEHAKEASLT